jgi:hypothetical protein
VGLSGGRTGRHPAGKSTLQPHEYFRDKTAKLLTLFRPVTGEVRAKDVEHAPHAVLHPWLKEELLAILEQHERAHPFAFPFTDTTLMPLGGIGIIGGGPMNGPSPVLACA